MFISACLAARSAGPSFLSVRFRSSRSSLSSPFSTSTLFLPLPQQHHPRKHLPAWAQSLFVVIFSQNVCNRLSFLSLSSLPRAQDQDTPSSDLSSLPGVANGSTRLCQWKLDTTIPVRNGQSLLCRSCDVERGSGESHELAGPLAKDKGRNFL
ncbi:hypothetical protein L596_005783 [Steinernema carpocapsae]|uniref:Uncharacterized protein n=1 Tax=Steinernema carpocapsae TaxID=34508 RepID=A0A4U8V0D1_STECR|nr:hypothetical protein L596_005783 [Steinernema carpocapsae]